MNYYAYLAPRSITIPKFLKNINRTRQLIPRDRGQRSALFERNFDQNLHCLLDH